jgi:serine/threonine-protein kinase
VNAGIPEELSQIAMKALAKKPDDRFQSAEDFLAALKSIGLDKTVALAVPALAGTKGGSNALPVSPNEAAQAARISHSPQTMDRVSRKLAVYIGPISRIVVQRAAIRYGDLPALYRAVAEEIESATDREKFLASQRRRLE